MKLLNWMHRKLQKDAKSSMQASVTGSSCTPVLLKPSANNQGDYITSNDSKQAWNPNQQCQHKLKEFNGETTEELHDRQSTEIFPGFLTIGTLSVELVSDPPTPKLDLPHQVTNESGMAEMKYDLKLINEELEKFFKLEAEKEYNVDLSRKNSQASTITLFDEVKEDVNDNSVSNQVYPLQGYLLGSSTELLETKPNLKKKKLSFCKLFKKSTTMDRCYIKEAERTQKQVTQKIKSSNHSMKKMLHPTQTSPTADSIQAQTKLNKISQLFHKKVHPEISKAAYASKEPKYSKYKKKKTLSSSNGHVSSILSSEKTRITCWGTLKKENNHCSHNDTKLPQVVINKHNMDLPLQEISDGAEREHWIDTDEEYFVLELQQNKGIEN